MTAVNQRHHSDDTSYEMEHNEFVNVMELIKEI